MASHTLLRMMFYHLAVFLLLGGGGVLAADGDDGDDADIQLDGLHTLDDQNADNNNNNNNSSQNQVAGYQVEQEEEKVVAPKNSMNIPDFSLIEDNRVCLRVSFESRIIIKYRTTASTTAPTRVLEAETQVPEDAVVSGKCGREPTEIEQASGNLTGKNTAELQLAWDVFTLTFTFALASVKDESFSSPILTWAAESVAMSMNMSSPLFHTPQSGGLHKAISAPNDTHFNTPANFSFSCFSEQEIQLSEEAPENSTAAQTTIISADLAMWSIQIQAFQLPADGEFQQAAKCVLDVSLPTQSTVPIAVAAVLAVAILIVLIGYFVARHNSKLQYRAME